MQPIYHFTIFPQNGRGLPERKRALSTVNSSAKRMWQKFFLLLRMAMISPHWPKTSTMSCSVAFSGRPPTNTVLQPGGRSLMAGGGRSAKHGEENEKTYSHGLDYRHATQEGSAVSNISIISCSHERECEYENISGCFVFNV